MPSNQFDSSIAKLRQKLHSSPTAASSGAAPTAKDVSLDTQLRAAQAAKSTALGKQAAADLAKNAPAPGEAQPQNHGIVGRALKFLGTPLYATAGAVETALGKGTKPGLLENIKANINEGGTFGDILRQSGVTNWVSMPVGFALDVAMDPVNWVTAGTDAIVPRIAKGIYKAGPEGAAAALKSSVASKLDNMLASTGSEAYRKYIWENSPLTGKLAGPMQQVATVAKDSSKVNSELAHGGASALERLTQNQQTNVDKFMSAVGEALNKVSPGATDWLKTHFWGDGKKVIEDLRLKDAFVQAPEGSAWEKSQLIKKRQEAMSFFDEGDMLLKGEIPTRSASSMDNAAKMATDMADAQQESIMFQSKLDDVIKKYLQDGSPESQKLRQMGEAAQKDYLATFTSYKTGVEGFDKALANKLLNGTAQKFFQNHAKLMGIFRAGVIGMSIPARVYQMIGNFAAFTPIAGINPFNVGFTKSLVRATKFSYTQDIKHLQEMLSDPEILTFLRSNPETFTKIMGIKAEFLSEGSNYLRRRVAELANIDPEMKAAIDSQISHFDEMIAKGEKPNVAKTVAEATQEAITKGLTGSAAKQARREGVAPFTNVGTAFGQEAGTINMMQEFNMGVIAKWTKELEVKAAKGDKAAKVLSWYLTKPMEDYGRGDQIFKLGTVMHLTRNGISESEMRTLQKWYKFKPGDIIQSKNGLRFKLTPNASMDVANEMYLNFQALPSWAKIARSMPIIGAPFASFQAGAQKNILKGIGYNLSYFNKVQQIIHEVSGDKSPLERQALESPYYSNIKDNPAMLKLNFPFFQQNPIYLNLGNAMHQYGLNLIEGGNRTYKSKYGTEFVSLIDKSPFLKDPTGQFMLNYAILPYLLGQAIGPFNNELYPENAPLAQKAGLTATGALEPLVPKSPGAAAALTPVPVSETALPYVPSYGFRRLRNALAGKTATGTNSSEPPASRTARTISAELGLPVYRVQLGTKNNTKKK